MSEANMSANDKIHIRQELITKFTELQPLVEDVIERIAQLDCAGTWPLEHFLDVIKSY